MSKIIIVEDEAVIRDELIEFLMRYGYEVESPTDFKNILEYIEEKKADLILLCLFLMATIFVERFVKNLKFLLSL